MSCTRVWNFKYPKSAANCRCIDIDDYLLPSTQRGVDYVDRYGTLEIVVAKRNPYYIGFKANNWRKNWHNWNLRILFYDFTKNPTKLREFTVDSNQNITKVPKPRRRRRRNRRN